jgi:hypothetical protein
MFLLGTPFRESNKILEVVDVLRIGCERRKACVQGELRVRVEDGLSL